MRMLHTSDWHLGRSFHGEGMLQHQAAYIDHLIEMVRELEIDAVLIAGDIYDRALPPVDAVALADEAFSRLVDTGARTIVTSGNHDSARRLGFGARLLDRAGLFMRTDAGRVGTPIIVPHIDGEVAVYGLPYLDPDTMRTAWDLPVRSHHAALSAAMERVNADRARRSGRSVVMAHAFVAGGEPSDSERDIAVGGVSRVAASIFDGIDYVALGHLHGRQVLSDRVRYCGSPLAYSFSEANQTKGSWLIELDAFPSDTIDPTAGELKSNLRAEFIEAPVPRPLRRLSGNIDELLTEPTYADAEHAWVQATLTGSTRPAHARDRLLARFPHLLSIHFEHTSVLGAAQSRRAVAGRSDHEIALGFLTEVRQRPADETESRLLQQACEACAGDALADAVVGSS